MITRDQTAVVGRGDRTGVGQVDAEGLALQDAVLGTAFLAHHHRHLGRLIVDHGDPGDGAEVGPALHLRPYYRHRQTHHGQRPAQRLFGHFYRLDIALFGYQGWHGGYRSRFGVRNAYILPCYDMT